MTVGRAAITGRAARWALLACPLFGLVVMHTLGHAGMHRNDHAAHRQAPAAAAMTHVSLVLMPAAGDCPASPHLGGPAGPGHGGLAHWTACLAVLTGLAVLLLAALVVRSRRGDSPPAATGMRPLVPRAPPRLTGLRLAAVSVLRL